jgi:hypothetical protein
MDFETRIGRLDKDGKERYNDLDLLFAIDYVGDLMVQGFVYEPFYRFKLSDFRIWCREQLTVIK